MTEPGLSRDDAIKLTGSFLESLPLQSFGAGSLRSDVRWTADFFEEGTIEGVDAVNEALKPLLAAFPDLQVTLSEEETPAIFESGRVAFEVTITGTHTGDLPGVGTTGRSIEGQGVAFVTFDEEGKVAAVRTHWDW